MGRKNILNLSLLVQRWREDGVEPGKPDNSIQCADELEAALAQQAQPDPCIDHDLRIQRLVEANTLLKAQQAQPLTDEPISMDDENATEARLQYPNDADKRSIFRQGADWRKNRDRMAQQAREHALIEVMREGEHVTAVLARQAQPLTDEVKSVGKRFEEWRDEFVASFGCEPSAKIAFKVGWGIRERMPRQAQPEMPTRGQIAKWRAWWLGMADEAANAGTKSGEYNARLYRDVIEDFDYTVTSFAKETTQQAQPRCEHGRTDRHMVRATDSSDTDIWCPGPTPQREPTLDEVRGLGPELLDFEFAQPDQAEKDRRAKVIADLYNTAKSEPTCGDSSCKGPHDFDHGGGWKAHCEGPHNEDAP